VGSETPGQRRLARGLSDTLQGLAAVATALLGGLVSSALLGAWGWLCAPVTGVIGFVVLLALRNPPASAQAEGGGR